MRIIFMGSPAFAVPSLDALVERGHVIAAVYSQPPRPAGRGKADRPTAVHQRARDLGLDVRTPSTLRDADEQARLAGLDADLAIVAAYGLILPRAVLDAPRAGCVNVHASLLPRWRGAAPVQRAILAGDRVSGITIMRMEEGLDTGPMLRKAELPLEGMNAGQATERLAQLGARTLLDWLDDPVAGEAQDDALASYAPKVAKSETRIDWTASAEQVVRQVRAFAPSPGAWFAVAGERMRLLDAEVPDSASENAVPGQVLDERLTVRCGTGVVRPLTVQRAGRGPMAAADLLRGFAIPPGTILE